MKRMLFSLWFVILSFSNLLLAQSENEEAISEVLGSFDAAFVLYDLENDAYIRYNPERCAKRFVPASTFKILNSLIGLETGVIEDEDFVIPWDSTNRQFDSWNQDHSLKTAIKNSVVWYYQELARRVGEDRMQVYVDKASYGNKDISGGIDQFWLRGGLRISAEEQIEFLKKFYKGELSFSKRSIDIVKEIMLLEEDENYKLKGKTGTGILGENDYLAWLVGYVEIQDNVYLFVLNYDAHDKKDLRLDRVKIVKDIFKKLNILH